MFVFSGLFSISSRAGDLSIKVNGVKGNLGVLQIALFDDDIAYGKLDYHRAYAVLTLPARNMSKMVTLYDLPDGDYVISLLHDENKNGVMETNRLGLPTEGYGISNTSSVIDTLSFDDAKFLLGNDAKTAIVDMHYLAD